MNHWTDRFRWALRRRRRDDSRKRTPVPRKIGQKLTNLIRRLTIFLSRPYMRQFSHRSLPDLESISSVLIIPHDPIGDLLLTEPLWRKLRSERPDLKIGLVISSRNKELAEAFSGIDALYNLYGGSVFSRWRELLRARHAQYAVVLAPVGFYKPARFAFIARFVAGHYGFTATMHHSRPKRYSEFYSYCTERAWQPYPQPMVEQYQALVERVLGVHFTEDERPPRLVTPKINLQKAKEVIRSIKEVEEVKHVILAHLEAKVETREWGMENLIQLIEQLPNMAIVATASPHYWATHRRSLPTSPRIRRVDTGSILDAIGLLDSVDLLLSPDTSMVHFAAALRKPIVAFYPYKDEWLPYRADSIVLYPVRSEPISTIGVAEVRDAIFALLSD